MATKVVSPQYGSLTDILGSGVATWLNSLANGATATSDMVDNSSNLFDEVLVELYLDGTAATTGLFEVRLAVSLDGTNFGTWESAIALPIIPFNVDLQRYTARFPAPKYWKIMVQNRSGSALAASGNTAKYMGVNMIVV